MKKSRISLLVVVVTLLALAPFQPCHAKFGDFLKNIKKVLGVGELSEEKIINGLKEALEIGTGNAVNLVSKMNGYYKNPRIKIPLPPEIQKGEKVLRKLGLAKHVDAFEISMNRAAEQAAPKAKALFWDAIKKMSFEDARKILNGRSNEATLYFKDRTAERLANTFKPIVHTAMARVGVTRYYQAISNKLRTLSLDRRHRFDLDKFVTEKALDGLFLMLEEEEKKIRTDPGARVTQLLKEVFGGKK